MVFIGGTFGRWLGHASRALMVGISALIRDLAEVPSSFGHMRTQHKVCDPEEGPHQTVLAPWSRTFTLWKINTVVHYSLGYGALLQQPQGTKTSPKVPPHDILNSCRLWGLLQDFLFCLFAVSMYQYHNAVSLLQHVLLLFPRSSSSSLLIFSQYSWLFLPCSFFIWILQ